MELFPIALNNYFLFVLNNLHCLCCPVLFNQQSWYVAQGALLSHWQDERFGRYKTAAVY